MRLIPDFATMENQKIFAFLKFGVAQLFVLFMMGLAFGEMTRPFWLQLALHAILFFLACYVAIVTSRGIQFLEQRLKKSEE